MVFLQKLAMIFSGVAPTDRQTDETMGKDLDSSLSLIK